MALHIVVEQRLRPGQALTLEGPSPNGRYSVAFKDDGLTAVFYAVDTQDEADPVKDGLLVYRVSEVIGRAVDALVAIGWSDDHEKVVLVVNSLPLAAFDFSAQRGYARTALPVPDPGTAWGRHGHAWDDAVAGFFM